MSRKTYLSLVRRLAVGIACLACLTCLAACVFSPPGGQPAMQMKAAGAASSATVPAVKAATASAAPSTTLLPTATLTETPLPTGTTSPTKTLAPVTLIGAGDIAVCNTQGAEITAQLIEQFPGAAVFTAGDNTNELTTHPAPLKPCFDQTWGRFRDRIHPAPGNHEYFYEGASDYFAYFGAAAGVVGQGWYSYDLGDWHIVVLNSECDQVGGCQAGSPQETWLKADLAAHPALCSLAIWHRPRFSSGIHGSDPVTQDLWKDLYAAGAEMVISGHDHEYERFAPMDAGGALDPTHGIIQFVVGTGGADLRQLPGKPADNSQVTITGVYGVLKLSLRPDSYDWQFIPEPGKTAGDGGSAACH